MSREQIDVINSFPELRVLVIGDAMLDRYLEGNAARICREAPAPIVDVAQRVDVPGGAANTAANVAALGARTAFIGVIGDDDEGASLREALRRADVDTTNVIAVRGRRTLAKHRVLAASQLLLRFDQGDTSPVDVATGRAIIERLRLLVPACDAVVVSDYAYGVLTDRVVGALTELCRRHRRVAVVDARDLPRFRELRPSAVKPNYDEALALLGGWRVDGSDARAAQVSDEADRLLDATGARIAAITLDADGAIVCERGAPPYRTYAQPSRNVRSAGAGDTFVAALAMSLAAGADAPTAAEVASAAAAVVVAKDGTSCCTVAELRDQLSVEGKYVVDAQAFASRMRSLREQGKRVVFTNGCFDILHRGHITYLNQAKALGDVLVVAVNSDASVAVLKGPGRPVNTLEDRVEVLAALSCIDQIVAFEDETPAELIRAVRPDVYVKGGDYTRETLPETPLVEALGGTVRILPYLDQRSTTGVIERIRAAVTPGDPALAPVSQARATETGAGEACG